MRTSISFSRQLCKRYWFPNTAFFTVPGLYCLSHQEMPPEALMAHTVIVWKSRLPCIFQGTGENPPVILIYDLAARNIDDIMEAPPAVHTQRQRAVLIFISE